MRALTLQSPAKVNLYLRVLSRRRDGYHDLVTLFRRISLADTIRLRKSQSFSLSSTSREVPTGETNLITRAYRLLKANIPHLGGVSVHLTKRIPIGAGLGGGSSNAAAFLLGMKRLYELKISKKECQKLAAGLGADVPFFLEEANQAMGIGRGDRILLRPAAKQLWFLLVLPSQGLSTKRVYQRLPRQRRRVSLTKTLRAVRLLCKFLEGKHLGQVAHLLQNDLELPAFRLRPSLQKIFENLKIRGATAVRMSGSGTTLYVLFSSRREAKNLAQKFRRQYPSQRVMVCHSI